LTVEFPLAGWTFSAELTWAGDECSRVTEVPLERRDDGTFVLRPAGYAGSYDVTLFGQGGDSGDLYVAFRWTTPKDGPLPAPEARLAVLANNRGDIDSYGIELEIKNLVRTPSEASAKITVMAPNGRSVTFDGDQEELDCTEGTVYWGGPDEEGLAAADLSERGPFQYDVQVQLDGVEYRASATWPDDQIVGNEPSVRLNFEPALPALAPSSTS
jgi:hypothetical protein